MEVNIWLPIWLGLGCFGISTMLALLVPEPPREPVAVPEAPQEATSHIDHVSVDKHSSLTQVVRSGIHKLGQAMAWVAKRHYHITALLFTLLLTTFGRFAQELLAQYVTKRYEWSWSQVSALFLHSHLRLWSMGWLANISSRSQVSFCPSVLFATLFYLLFCFLWLVIYLSTSGHSRAVPRISGLHVPVVSCLL